MTVYTSPLTNAQYDIVTREETRMAGNWYAGEALRPVTVTYYDIYLDGKKVQFALSEDGIPASVANYEGVSDSWTTSPRD
jgi:hypothetical protein